jgi:Holliday junction resolvasome RuvABC DNA-binding subunit
MAEEKKQLGFDDSPPRNNLILLVGIGSVITLALLEPLFSGYFDHMVREREAQQLTQARERTDRLAENLAREEQQLASARVSVEQAMQQLARVGRRAGPEPQASEDVQAVLGWNQLPNTQAEAAARAAAGTAAAPTEGTAPAEGAAPAEGTAPAEGAAPAEGTAPAAPAPAAPAEGGAE